MGVKLSKEPKSDQLLARQIRKHNCKVNRRLFKLIESAYIDGALTEMEYQVNTNDRKNITSNAFKIISEHRDC
jgi:N-acetylmuramoyl-L-alanine amidase